ncbi:MAG: DUF4105 domain-containing protein [Gemmatimonadetes bacterium]|nr:DUF4105 domain-containing protein [Gemmatimonadota bacterium]MBI3568420.1 DUF4105 domain-containing protein [Gemmatimonadota bacterium]
MRSRLLRAPLVALALTVAASTGATAQPAPRAASAASAASAATGATTSTPVDTFMISVLTMGPGEELFNRFGHQSVRIRNLRTGLDSAYNWGMFDFDQPHFIVRFLTGETRYWMQSYPTVPLVTAYRAEGRSVWEQELDLTPAEKDSLVRYVQWNAREENKWYRYDYYRDNCATRVRDLIDRVTGGAFQRALAGRAHGVTYRGETMRLARAFPAINVAMDLALGTRADSTLSAWDEMFVPMRLREWVREAKVTRADGSVRPLMKAEQTLVEDPRYADAPTPPNYIVLCLALGVGVALLAVALGARAYTSDGARWTLGAVGGLWHLVVGIAGTLVALAGLFTRHVYMGHNLSVLLATPASIALALLIPLALAKGAPRLVVKAARGLVGFTAGAAVVGCTVSFAPFYLEHNGAVLALLVPAHLGLTWAVLQATTYPRDAR